MATRPSAGSRTLTVAGKEVARIGLGTNRLTSTPENHAFLRQAAEAGLGLIEAARQIVPIAAVQNHYNVAERGFEDVVDYCEENGIVFVPYYPLKGGGPPALARVADSHDTTAEQIALAWLLRRSPVMLPI